jgi:transcriptional repressor NrdR
LINGFLNFSPKFDGAHAGILAICSLMGNRSSSVAFPNFTIDSPNLQFFCLSPRKRLILRPMRCPFCDADKESLKVIDSRTCEGGRAIRRRRECLKCAKRFTTYERIEDPIRLMVIKKDGQRVPWDRTKIMAGLERACFKRPVPESELLRITDEVEEEVYKTHDREVPTSLIGQLVTDRLRRVDQVAYVRFASVYRQFKTLEELVDEARAVLDARRYEVPGQGSLFIEPPKPGEANGSETAPTVPKQRTRKARPAPAPEQPVK